MHRLRHCIARQYHAQLFRCRSLIHIHPSTLNSRYFTTRNLLLKDDDSGTAVKGRWYEKFLNGKSERNTSMEEDEDEEKEIDKITEELEKQLKSRIIELEDELTGLRSGINFDLLSPEERTKVKQALEDRRTKNPSEDPRLESIDEDEDRNDLVIKFDLPFEDKISLQRLNECLQTVGTGLADTSSTKDLWKWYTRCKHRIPSLLHQIPDSAWHTLWESQNETPKNERNRAVHLRIILEDMVEGGKSLDVPQRLAFIDLLYEEGRFQEALPMWEKEKKDLLASPETAQYFEDLGVRLLASVGKAQKAEDLAITILRDRQQPRARVLTPIIEAWVRQGNESSVKRAWALYLHLRAQIGTEILMEDYDEITTSFIRAGRPDFALAVFKDLMLTNKHSPEDSIELYKTSLGLYGKLQSQSISTHSLNGISLTALTVLPRRFQNRFFYASWMKKLIGEGQLDAAATVLELMYERGVKPDPKHLNGIIAAFLRSGNAGNREKALNMGWAMIQERLDFVAKRHSRPLEAPNGISVSQIPDLRIPFYLQRIVPPASIETFSILLLYYGRRNMAGYVEHLQTYLKTAELPPNSYWMNHLLYAELRRGNHPASWQIYLKMTKKVRPNLETFACLWDCEKLHIDRQTKYRSDYFPGARRVFTEMMTWFSQLSAKDQKLARAEFSMELYTQTIRCLCLAKDNHGTIVALYALRDYFNIYPNADTARMVAFQIARTVEEKPKAAKRRRTHFKDNAKNAVNAAKVAHILKFLTAKRMNQLESLGTAMNQMSEEQQAKERLYILTECFCEFLRSMQPEDAIEKGIQTASWEMGVGGIKFDGPLASESSPDSENNN